MKKPLIICLMLMPIVISACGSGKAMSAPSVNGAAADSSANIGSVLGSTADSGAGGYSYDAFSTGSEAPAPSLVSGAYSGVTPADASQPEKIIKIGAVELSTNNFDSDKTRLEALTKGMGGFIERSSVYGAGNGRRYEAVLRVPGERFDEMKKAVEGTGGLVSSNENEQNVTGQYYDAVGRLGAKRVEETQILEMIDKADKIDTLLTLEDYLERVRSDINVLESQIKDIDSLSSYSTINVNMTEVLNVKLMADTGNFGQKLLLGFRSSVSGTASFFGNILVFLAGAAIPLALIALLAVTGVIAYKKLFALGRKGRVSQ